MDREQKLHPSLNHGFIRQTANAVFTIAFIFILMILASVVLLLTPIRLFVYLFAKFYRPNIVDFVRSTSASLTFLEEPNNKHVITVLQVIDGTVPLQKLVSDVKERLVDGSNGKGAYQKLQQMYVNFGGYLFRERDPNFKIRDHVFEFKPKCKPVAGTGFYTKEDIPEILKELVNRNWRPEQRSQWEILVMQNYKDSAGQPESQSVLVSRFHHNICDGFSLVQLFKHLGRDEISKPQKMNLRNKILSHLYTLNEYARMWSATGEAFVDSLLDTIYNRDWIGMPKSSDQILVGLTQPFHVDRIKAVRKHFNVHYSAVIFAMVGGAFQKMIKSASKFSGDVPNEFLCVTPLPQSNHPGALSNHVYGGPMTILTKEMSPIQRLCNCDALVQKRRKNRAKYGMQLILNLVGLFPTCLRDTFYKYAVMRPKVIVSDMIPMDAFCYDGSNVLDVYCTVGFVPHEPGMLIAQYGLSHMVRLGVTIPTGMFSGTSMDANNFCWYLEKELKTLEELCGNYGSGSTRG